MCVIVGQQFFLFSSPFSEAEPITAVMIRACLVRTVNTFVVIKENSAFEFILTYQFRTHNFLPLQIYEAKIVLRQLASNLG